MVWGGSGLKPLTPMGVAMLGTGAVLIPGGVLVPARARSQHQHHPQSAPRGCRVANVGVLPDEGVRGAATSPLTLKAAICCIWAAAMAAMGLRQVPCAAAIRAACCCMIFRKEEGKGDSERREKEREGKVNQHVCFAWIQKNKCHSLPHPRTGVLVMLNMGPPNPTITLSCEEEALHLPLNRDTPALPGIHTPWHWCFHGPN